MSRWRRGRRMTRRTAARAAAWLVAAALLAGAEEPGRVGDLLAPRTFPIDGDVPLPPPPPAATPTPLPVATRLPAPPATPVPVATPIPTPRPAAPAGPALTPSYTVQVGAFRSLEQARALAGRLAAKGYEPFVVTVDLGTAGGQGIWHRVRVGRFPDRQPAADLAARLAGTERVPAQVLRETPGTP